MPTPATLLELLTFDVRYGLPTSLSVLRSQLSPRELGMVLAALAKKSLRDPLAAQDTAPQRWDETQDKLVRHQLRALFRLDDATRGALHWGEPRRIALLGEVVAATGSVFISKNVPFPAGETWRGADRDMRGLFAQRLQGRLFNTLMKTREVSRVAVAFDVTACRFVQLCRAFDRMYLAPLFCEADSRFFRSGGATGIQLQRTKTIARGDDVCDFRFVWKT